MKFEESMQELEEIVRKMEGGNLPLDDALGLFEKGMKLSLLCSKKLEAARAKIEILTKNKDGELLTQPFCITQEG
ncbi:exodeoxyribonuclease VII small subunit [Candidatus Desantisbacteria bacterium]|nr:exodeoxyribonuclease VII small subunit [Candidatus Desantisbacteria bacterium]